MARKLADKLADIDAEFEKLKSGRPDDETPREAPQRQAPGVRAMRRPDLDRWTTDELRRAAENLNLRSAGSLDREALIERLPAVGRRNPNGTMIARRGLVTKLADRSLH